MSAPGFLAVGGIEVANNARTAAYLGFGYAGDRFEVVSPTLCPNLITEAFPATGTDADLFPHDTLWPSDNLFPGMYGVFLDPGTDNAPWIDADYPESYGYLGMLISNLTGLDGMTSHGMDPSADGVGGIIGPENLQPRELVITGVLISTDCNAMEYARRWLANTLAGSICDGCIGSPLQSTDLTGTIDVRTTCGESGQSFYTNRWRIYDVGLNGITIENDDSPDCCFVANVEIHLSAADPFLYDIRTPVLTTTTLNPGGSDASLVSFETWLYGQPTQVCSTITNVGNGIDAPIITFTGGNSGIEAGTVYTSMGAYPSEALWPGDCLIPSDGQVQWSNNECPFVFNLSIGAGETFVVDASRRKVAWLLADGTILDGSPKLNLDAGTTIQWPDTCNGADLLVCAGAYASCACDDTASVTIQSQHRER